MNMPADRPSPIAIVRALCTLPFVTPEPGNYERDCLQHAHKYLSEEPPNVIAARQEIGDGLAHAFRRTHREQRPEAWVVAACAELLRHV